MADNSERGSTLVTVAILLVVLFSFMALAVDVGVGYVERRRIQAVADAASLAGAQMLTDNYNDAAIWNAVVQYAQVLNPPATGESRVVTAKWMSGTTNLGIDVNGGGRPTGVTGILVTVRGTTPTFFANILGVTQVTAAAQGGGGYSPLDVMLVIDRSISMAFYSCNFERFFASGQPCRNLIPGLTPEFERIMNVYYSCSDCGGMWVQTPTPTRAWYPTPGPSPTPIPGKCYWVDHYNFLGNPVPGVLMTPVPGECTGGVASRTTCEACDGAIVPPLQPMTDAQGAADYFISLVDAQLAPTYPRMGLVTYSTYGHLDVPLTYTSGAVTTGVDAAIPDGNTNCDEGLYLARNELSSRGRATAVKAIVFLTDGQANLYVNCYDRNRCSESTARSKAIAEATAAKAQGIRIYTIGLGTGADQTMLQQIAADSGGTYLYAPTAADLAAAYEAMFTQIKRLRLVQ